MPRTLQLAEHFSEDELYERYRHCTDLVERTHWQIIWLKKRGQNTPDQRSHEPERIRSLTLYPWWPGGADHTATD